MRVHRVSMNEMASRERPRLLVLTIAICALLGAGLAAWWRDVPPVQSAALEDSASEAPQAITMGEASPYPASALKLGLWPGLPNPPSDPEAGRDLHDPVQYTGLEIEEAEKAASSILEGSFVEMVASLDELSGAVRAEMARFNLGFLNALRARVTSGDPKVVGRAWKAFAGRQFMPEPDPVQAWAHGLVARRLPAPWSEQAPTETDYQRLVENGLGPKEIGRAREMSETLWPRCCATSFPR